MNEKKDVDFLDHPVSEIVEGALPPTPGSHQENILARDKPIIPGKEDILLSIDMGQKSSIEGAKEKLGEKEEERIGSKFSKDGTFDTLVSKLDALGEQVQSLESEFKSKIKYDQHKEKVIDDLHRELQEYKNDLLKGLLCPLVLDVIHTIDDIRKLVHHHRLKDSTELSPLELIKQMAGISADLEDILFRQGIESFNCPQDEFDPGRQKIIKTENINEPSKDKTIAKRVHNGYDWEGKVLRKEMVDVFVYKPEAGSLAKNKDEENNHE